MIVKKLKRISVSQSKHNKFEDYKNFLDGEDYQQKCENYLLRSTNHEMYLQKVKKSTLPKFDDKRRFESKTRSLL